MQISSNVNNKSNNDTIIQNIQNIKNEIQTRDRPQELIKTTEINFIQSESDNNNNTTIDLALNESNEVGGVVEKKENLAVGEEEKSNVVNNNNNSNNISHLYPTAPIYPTETPTLHTSPVKILSTPDKGRGIYASQDLKPGTLIDISPVLLLNDAEYYGGGKEGEGKGVEGSCLRGYVFTWRGKEKGFALALGMGSLFNHSIVPNVSFELNRSAYTIQYKTFKSVKEGEELCIFYGHKTRFENETISTEVVVKDEGVWGGLNEMGDGLEDLLEKEQKSRDDEIILFVDLDWTKVTSLINPEDQILTTFDCWALELPARHVPLAVEFIKSNSHDPEATRHLKRTKVPFGSRRSGDSLLSIILFPTFNSPPLEPLLANSSLAFLNLVPYIQPVPAMEPRTNVQAKEWGTIWPVQTFHVKEGTMQDKPRGWERAKRDWIKRESEKCWKAAVESGRRGEHPIACHVTDTFEPAFHSSTSLPKTLVRSHDTRLSTQNVLSHAASNLIDAVSVLDRQNIRPHSHLPHLPLPYLLTGMTVFISHEPCLLCAMSLLHSRISQLYFIKSSNGSGGCGSVYSVHEDGGLNHRFEVWQWSGENDESGKGLGIGLDVLLDP